MSISKEAVEAAAREIYGSDWDDYETVMLAALTAALPHLAPKPTDSDEEVGVLIARMCFDDDVNFCRVAEPIIHIISAVRAEERAAQATQIAALREALKRTLAWTEEYRLDNEDIPAERDRVDLAIAEARAALEMSGGVG